jgi:hypothetical protein
MKNQKLISLLAGVALAFSIAPAVLADDGVVEIGTKAELQSFADAVNNGEESYQGKTVKLTADIDLKDTEWKPIGDKDHIFKGSFDGGGYKISNITITASGDYLGLFGNVNGGTLENINVDTVKIENGSKYLGGIVGSAIVNNIKNCTAKNVTIKGNHWAGGIGGYTYANYDNCDVDKVEITLSSGLISNDETGDKAGGIVGLLGEGQYTVKNCDASNVDIAAIRDVGGIAGATAGSGSTYTMLFENCTSSGSVEIRSILLYRNTAGGILGKNCAVTTFRNCSSTATINSSTDTGKLCGKNDNSNPIVEESNNE